MPEELSTRASCRPSATAGDPDAAAQRELDDTSPPAGCCTEPFGFSTGTAADRDVCGERRSTKVYKWKLCGLRREPVETLRLAATDEEVCFSCDKLKAPRRSRAPASRSIRWWSRSTTSRLSSQRQPPLQVIEAISSQAANRTAADNPAIHSSARAWRCTKKRSIDTERCHMRTPFT